MGLNPERREIFLAALKRYAVFILPPLLLALLFYLFYYRPAAGNLERLKGKTAEQHIKIRKDTDRVRKLNTVKSRYESLLQEWGGLKASLTAKDALSSLFNQVSALARDSGLMIESWEPRSRVLTEDFFYSVPVGVEIKGSYHRFGRLLSSLSGLEKILKIDNLELAGQVPAGGGSELKITFDAVTFSEVPEEELRRIATEKAKKEKKEKKKAPSVPESRRIRELLKEDPEFDKHKEVTYTAGSRRDPFLSLLAKMQQKRAERKRHREPLERYDLAVFRLIGIIYDGSSYYAAVVLPDGKSYTLREGMAAGLYDGKVALIERGSVIVREMIYDYKGTPTPKDFIIKLPKAGD